MSSRSNYKYKTLALWANPGIIHASERAMMTKENPLGTPNLEVWKSEKVAEFVQKKHQDWCPQWSEDEQLCARNVTNEVHCFEGGAPVHDGAILDVQFTDFSYPTPDGFDRIMFEKSIL